MLNNIDLWPAIHTLDYGDWLTDETNMTRDGSHPGMTSFQLMMVTFGNVGTGINNVGQNKAAQARTDSVRAASKTARDRPQGKINADKTPNEQIKTAT